MKPTIEAIPDGARGWRLEWSEIGIQMDVCPLSSGRDATEAEVTVRALTGEGWGHMVGPVSVGMDEIRSRSYLGRYLAGRGRRSVDWAGLVEQAFVLVLRQVRGGRVEAPASDSLAALLREELPPLRHVIPDLITEGCWLLGGHPKVGKSWLLLNLGLAVAFGGKALGHIPIEQPGRVLYLALEDGKRRLQGRVRDVLRDQPAPERFEYRTSWNSIEAGGIDELDAWCEAHPDTRLVMIDTLAKMRGDSRRRGESRLFDEDYQSIAGLQELAGRRGLAILMNLHLRKSRGEEVDPLQALSGTMGLSAGADGILVLDRKRYHNDAILSITSRDLPRDREIGIWWDQTLVSWVYSGDAADVRLSMQRKSILDALRESGEAQTPKDLTAMTGIEYGAIRRILPQMQRAGQVRQTARGLYALGDIPEPHRSTVNTIAQKSDQGDQAINSDNAINAINGGPDEAKRSHRSPDRPDRIDRIDRPTVHNGRTGPPCPECGQATTPDGICRRCDVRACAGDPSHATGSLLRSRCAVCAMRGSG